MGVIGTFEGFEDLGQLFHRGGHIHVQLTEPVRPNDHSAACAGSRTLGDTIHRIVRAFCLGRTNVLRCLRHQQAIVSGSILAEHFVGQLQNNFIVIIGTKLLHEPIFPQKTAGCQYRHRCFNFLMLAVLLHPNAAAPVIGVLQYLFCIAVQPDIHAKLIALGDQECCQLSVLFSLLQVGAAFLQPCGNSCGILQQRSYNAGIGGPVRELHHFQIFFFNCVFGELLRIQQRYRCIYCISTQFRTGFQQDYPLCTSLLCANCRRHAAGAAANNDDISTLLCHENHPCRHKKHQDSISGILVFYQFDSPTMERDQSAFTYSAASVPA